MYCELTSAGSDMAPPFNARPEMRSGGKPSTSAYSTFAPSWRNASTNTPIGRWRMRAVPVMRCVPGVVEK